VGILPAYPGKPESVFLSTFLRCGDPEAEAIAARWERILALRSEVANRWRRRARRR